MDEDEKEGREEVCVMRGTRERERRREREGGGERSLEALDFAIRSA